MYVDGLIVEASIILLSMIYSIRGSSVAYWIGNKYSMRSIPHMPRFIDPQEMPIYCREWDWVDVNFNEQDLDMRAGKIF